ncbi:hypothetical protein EKN42_13485 [Enterobacter hormaechei]|nr:hypothetical protein EKO10_12395 [Enterobacter hormaechei subsp. xiangfangensis]RTP40156.1 hypothetical protein EKN42_13485 [Enterobacter hormaechei]URL74668.1 hypothetical protein EZJ13_13200 [Enterobacter hormaechei]
MNVRRCQPDNHVDEPFPGDLVSVSSCLVSLIFLSGGKKTVIAICASTVNEYPESASASTFKIHTGVIFVSYMEDRLYKKCDAGQVTN